ncbi:MAG: DUF87 domain-containing protein, partial [Bacteroidota bacterium]
MIQDIERKLKELRGIMGAKADRMRLIYLAETEPEAKRFIEAQINILHAQRLNDDVHFLPPTADVAFGSYPLGTVQYNDKALYPFGIREGELPQHVVIAGRSGSGKSNTMRLLAGHFLKQRKPFMLFSFKREYRDLAVDDNLIFTCGRKAADFHFNPLNIPKGTDRDTWINLLAEAISSVYFL